MQIVSALELKQLSQQLNGVSQEAQLHVAQSEDRQHLHALSRARVSKWTNTIQGHRKQKLVARATRAAEEERQRALIDAEHAEAESRAREELIGRAKHMQYCQQDSVRAFHSRVLLAQVLEERDLQVRVAKLSRGQKETSLEDKRADLAHAVAMQQQAINTRLKAENIAAVQAAQMLEKRRIEAEEREARLLEQRRLIELDTEFQQESALKDAARRNEALMLRSQLDNMASEKRSRAIDMQTREKEQDVRIEAWVARKARQVEMKKDIEKKWFELSDFSLCALCFSAPTDNNSHARNSASLARRELIGQTQEKLSKDHDAKIEQQVNEAMRLQQEKAAHEDERKQHAKLARKQELKKYYDDYVQRNSEKLRIEKEQDKKLLDHYNQIHEEAVAEQLERKATLLMKGKTLQSYHKAQANRAKQDREKERIQSQNLDKQRVSESVDQDANLEKYMLAVANAPWAQTNSRLQKFVHQSLTAAKLAKSGGGGGSKSGGVGNQQYRQPVNTKERLGFMPGGYRKPDLVRMNPIVAGGYLEVVGEGKTRAEDHLAVVSIP
ncbi:hypothetical protein CcCBS67573_g04953 [Chytriomyces confervae]|uniref:Trichohyalin-plectin-homology domain-containing protein n=1 Tax=Chytriomyces confervae TaxID=246404 RepID=A0A507FBR4_9FUNG|nr:hypothetical protein CcCBS67573_g04953 [Chytriomyces confervae]